MPFDRQSRTRSLVAAVLIGLVAAGLGVWLLAGAGGDAGRRHVSAAGVPLDEVHPSGPAGARRPGVVVAHGFAGSARLMAQFGDSLAARGYVVVLLDFSGHGGNTRPLPDGAASTAASTAALQRDLDVAVAHLRGLPDVDPARIALVGHSMGASVVTRYAAAHPEIAATVAISLPGSPEALPDRLLVLVGQLEFPGFRAEAERAVAAGRSAIVVPGVEHITILYAQRTHRETAAWLDGSFGPAAADRPMPSPIRRVAGAGALLLALLVGLYPVGWLLLGGIRQGWSRPALPHLLRTVVVAAAAFASAALVAPLLPTSRLPLAIGNYVVGFTAAGGAAMLAYHRWRPGSPQPAPVDVPRGRRLALAAPILVGYAAVTIAVPLQLGLTHTVPAGARWWLLPVVWAGFALQTYAADRLAGGDFLGVLAVSAISVAALAGAAVTGLTSGFVLLVVPLLAVLLLWQAAWGAILHRLAAPSWLIALVGALIVAWPIAAALPVTG